MRDNLKDYSLEVRVAIAQARLKHYEVAKELGYKNATSFSRALARGIKTKEKRDRILEVIKNMKGGN